MTLNPDLVRARCRDIDDAVERLQRYAGMPTEEFASNPEWVDAACYRLLVAVEAALSLCYHISAKRLRRVPEEYAFCFEFLGEAGIVDGALAARLKAMARFRSLLVHMYARVEPRRIHGILRENLRDLREFAAVAAGLLDDAR